MCIPQCIHLEISRELIEQAKIDDHNLKRQKGQDNNSQIMMTQNNDIIGSIAQNIVFQYIEDSGVYVEKTDYYDRSINQDLCDFKHRGLNDIKGSRVRNKEWADIYPNTDFLRSDAQAEKVVDWYTFVRLDPHELIAHIAGVISYQDFNDLSEPIENLPFPGRGIKAKYLKSFYKYLFAV